MESATSFTAVSGWGVVIVGVTALLAALVAGRERNADIWLAIWLGEALLSFAIAGSATVRKARTSGQPLLSMPGKRFALSFSPPMIVGALLTVALYRAGFLSAIPGVWMLLYGTGIVTGGAFSVPVVPVMGLCFMAVGTAALFVPAAWPPPLAGFTSYSDSSSPGGTVAKSGALRQSASRKPEKPAEQLGEIPGRAAPGAQDLDRLIHERMRLAIVSALAVNESLTFNDLKKLLDTTDGNLSVHARKLEDAGYVACAKYFEGRLPKTEFRLTASGRQALERYLDHMEALIRATRDR